MTDHASTTTRTTADDATRPRPLRGPLAAATVVLAVLATAGCGGSSESGDEKSTTTSESTTSESTTTESTTTTVAPRPDADQASKDLAAAGVLQTADFGEGWKEYEAGAPYTPTEESCGYQLGGPEDALLSGASLNGPTVQLGDQPGYVSSRVYAFPTEADAIAWVEIAKGAAWGECNVVKSQEFQDENDSGVTMRLVTREIDTLGESGFEAYAEIAGDDEGGEYVYQATKSVYRLGRTVITSNVENGGMGDQSQALNDGEFAALSAAYGRVGALG